MKTLIINKQLCYNICCFHLSHRLNHRNLCYLCYLKHWNAKHSLNITLKSTKLEKVTHSVKGRLFEVYFLLRLYLLYNTTKVN